MKRGSVKSGQPPPTDPLPLAEELRSALTPSHSRSCSANDRLRLGWSRGRTALSKGNILKNIFIPLTICGILFSRLVLDLSGKEGVGSRE